MRHTIRLVVLTVLTTLLASTALAEPATTDAPSFDWPQFRGPERDGVARGVALAPSWPEGGPPEAFRLDVGAGFSGVAAAGDRLYTMTADDAFEQLIAIDRAGRVLWRVPVGARFTNDFGDGSRTTPTVVSDGSKTVVYTASADMRLAAVDARDGTLLWRRDLRRDFGATTPRFGFSPSPLVVGDLLVLEVGGGDGAAVAALDRHTGETRWTALDGGAGSSSPLLATIDGVEQIVVLRRPEVVGLSLDGEALWSHEAAPDAIVMPLFVPPDGVYISSAAMGDGGQLLRIDRGSQGWTVEEAWTQRRMRNHFNTAVHLDGSIYGFDNATLRCVSAADGSPCWAERGFGKGSVIAAASPSQGSNETDRLIVYSDDGELALVDATPEEYRERGRFQATEGRSWTAPTLAADLLIVRDHDELVAYRVGAETSSTATTGALETATRRAARGSNERSAPTTAADVAARYAAARGGLEAWRAVDTLRLSGRYATFSVPVDFTLVRRRGSDDASQDLYRIEHSMLGAPFVRGRDAEGLWWMSPAFGVTEGGPISIPPYVPQLAREALFEPPLLGWRDAGLEIELLGSGEVDGRPSIDLKIVFPASAGDESSARWEETWHLDPETWLEIAIDTPTVVDATQGPATFARRTYFSDFREVPTAGGQSIVVPHQVAIEFGARLEEITVESVEVDPDLPEDAFDRSTAKVEP